MFDPLMCDPIMCDPIVCDPLMCDPIMCDPLMCDPIMCDPIMCDPLMCDSIMCDPLMCDPIMCDPIVCDPIVCDPIICDTTNVCPPDVRLTGAAAAVRGSQIKVTCTVSGVADNTSPGVRWQIADSTVEEGLWEEGSQYTSVKEVVQLLPPCTAVA